MSESKMTEVRNYVQRPERWECNADDVVVDDCGRELLGRLANISAAGFMTECEEKVPMGTIVEVSLSDRERECVGYLAGDLAR